MDETPVTVRAVEDVGPETVAVTFETPEGFAAEPGQFVRVVGEFEGFEPPEGVRGLDVPLRSLAEEAGGAIMRNIVALGAACEVTGFDIAFLDESLEKRFGGKALSKPERRSRRGRPVG